jgi:hypothetical protein
MRAMYTCYFACAIRALKYGRIEKLALINSHELGTKSSVNYTLEIQSNISESRTMISLGPLLGSIGWDKSPMP